MKHLPTRVCRICQEEKPLTEFRVNKTKKSGYENICKKCDTERGKKYRMDLKNDPNAYQDYLKKTVVRSLKHKYGLTIDQYANLIDKYKVCQICGEEFSDKVTPHIDHNHETGKVRALLCRNCNLILGYAKDNPAIFKSAIKYLKKFDK